MRRCTFLSGIFMCMIFLCSCRKTVISNYEPEDLSARDEYESVYQLNKPLVAKDGFIKIEPVNLPEYINNMKTAPSKVMSNTDILIILYEEKTVPVIKETGIYKIDTGKYSRLFEVCEGRAISIECVDDGFVIYKETDTVSNAVRLKSCDIKTGKTTEIYNFRPQYNSSSASLNSIVRQNGKIYFDDIVYDSGGVAGVNIMEYDNESGQVSVYKENSQNPVLLDCGLMYISKDQDAGLFFLESSECGRKIYLSERISTLAPAGDEIYCINNKSNDEQTMRTFWSINSLSDNEELLVSSNAVDRLTADEHIVAWRNFTAEKPIVYLREQDSFTVLLDDEVAYNTYLTGDDCTLLICTHEDYTSAYYMISYVD